MTFTCSGWNLMPQYTFGIKDGNIISPKNVYTYLIIKINKFLELMSTSSCLNKLSPLLVMNLKKKINE